MNVDSTETRKKNWLTHYTGPKFRRVTYTCGVCGTESTEQVWIHKNEDSDDLVGIREERQLHCETCKTERRFELDALR